MTIRFRALLYPLLAMLCVATAPAQWEKDPALNTAVSTSLDNKIEPVAVADGSGGTIIAWREYSFITGYNIYAQRLDTLGFPRWSLTGTAICTTVNDNYDLRIASDGEGGALLVWRDYRSGTNWDIYAQKIDSSGAIQWTGDGLPVCAAAGHQITPGIVGDGTGGAIITWSDNRSGIDYDLYAQRINASGSAVWAANGIPVAALAGFQGDPQIVSDRTHGAIIVWEDFRSGTSHDIYAERIDSSGNSLWIPNGSVVSFAVNDQINPRAVSDETGTTIIAWEDARSGTSWDVYAQRVAPNGVLVWNPVAESICTAPLSQGNIRLADDGAGGAIVVWQDDRSGTSTDIYAQHLNHFGGMIWPYNGIPIVTAANHQQDPHVVGDGYGGGIIAWHDLRSGTEYDVYAQRVDSGGTVLWDEGGIGIGVAEGNQLHPFLVSDSLHGAIIVFEDGRSMDHNDIYAQNLVEDGSLGILPYVTATSGANGSVDPAGVTPVFWGGNLHVDITPQTGYHVDSVFVNGSYVGAPTEYDFTDVKINYTLHATFAINIYTIEATAGPYGTITPSGAIQVPYGFGQAFSFTPSGGYETGLVIVDGQEVGTPPTYFFPAVSQDHRIEAYFRNDSITLNYVRKRWNIVSVPSVVDDFSKSALYPSSVSEAYGFEDAYVPAPTMENGPGYWLKFDDPEVVFLYGTPLMTDTFNVSEGWNMVGSVSEEIPVSNITSIPPGIVTSQFFGYTTKYEVSSAIVPARGYWVKAEQGGQLVLSTSASLHPGNRIKIVPTDELPPAPPDESAAESKDPVPAAFALYPNYPNPFNPETAIRYDLPGGYDVTLSVYNTIGERVAFLSEGFRGPGSHIIRWDASGLPTGVYFYQLRAGPYTDIRKMVLMR